MCSFASPSKFYGEGLKLWRASSSSPLASGFDEQAGVVELVDTRDLKSRDLRVVWVQVPLLVLKSLPSTDGGLFCLLVNFVILNLQINSQKMRCLL